MKHYPKEERGKSIKIAVRRLVRSLGIDPHILHRCFERKRKKPDGLLRRDSLAKVRADETQPARAMPLA
jgi:hypothetical protein